MRLLAYSAVAAGFLIPTSVSEAQQLSPSQMEQRCATPAPDVEKDPEYREHDETKLIFMRARRDPWPPDVVGGKPVPTEENRFGGAYLVGISGEDALIEGDIEVGSDGAVSFRQALVEAYGAGVSKEPWQNAAAALGLRGPGVSDPVTTAPSGFLTQQGRVGPLSQTTRDLLYSLRDKLPVLSRTRLDKEEAAFVRNAANEAEAFVQELEALRPGAILATPIALGQLWKTLPIPYDSRAFDNPRRQQIRDAANMWNKETEITLFKEITSGQPSGDYIKLVRGGGCSSLVGKGKSGMQTIKLGDGCGPGAMRHEFGHALGLFHEQSHPERDQFVEIKWDNIKPKSRYNFKIATNISKPTAYDHCSIMHYGPKSFAINRNLPTIVPKGTTAKIGQREGPSVLDVQMIRTLYRPR